MSDADDESSLAIQKILQPLECAEGCRVPHGAYGKYRVRPEVTQLEHEGRALETRQDLSSAGSEELRRGAHDSVHMPGEQTSHEPSDHKTHVIKRPSQETLIRSD